MRASYVDLHTHSSASDGSDRPGEIVAKAASLGLAALALTDHDSLDGLAEAEEAARREHIELIRGIEIAVKDEVCGELHLLGLWMPDPSDTMKAALCNFRQGRDERNLAILSALDEAGAPVSMDEVLASSGGVTPGRPHIALAMLKKGFVETRREAFERYLGMRGTAYRPRELLTPEQGIGLLAGEGATVAIAHPCLGASMTAERLDDTLATFKRYGLSAIEAYHSSHDPAKVRLCVELASRHGLMLSGGSDYHGTNKQGIALGVGTGALRVAYWVLEKLKEHRRKTGLPV